MTNYSIFIYFLLPLLLCKFDSVISRPAPLGDFVHWPHQPISQAHSKYSILVQNPDLTYAIGAVPIDDPAQQRTDSQQFLHPNGYLNQATDDTMIFYPYRNAHQPMSNTYDPSQPAPGVRRILVLQSDGELGYMYVRRDEALPYQHPSPQRYNLDHVHAEHPSEPVWHPTGRQTDPHIMHRFWLSTDPIYRHYWEDYAQQRMGSEVEDTTSQSHFETGSSSQSQVDTVGDQRSDNDDPSDEDRFSISPPTQYGRLPSSRGFLQQQMRRARFYRRRRRDHRTPHSPQLEMRGGGALAEPMRTLRIHGRNQDEVDHEGQHQYTEDQSNLSEHIQRGRRHRAYLRVRGRNSEREDSPDSKISFPDQDLGPR